MKTIYKIPIFFFGGILALTLAFLAGLSALMGGCEKPVYANTTVWNKAKTQSFKIKSYAISWNDVGYDVEINNQKIMSFDNAVIFGKWVNDDSVLIVTNFKPRWNKKNNKTGIKIAFDTLCNGSPYLYDKKLLRLENLKNDSTIYTE